MEPLHLDAEALPGAVLDEMSSTGRRVEVADEDGKVLGVIISPEAYALFQRLVNVEDYRLVAERAARRAAGLGPAPGDVVLNGPDEVAAFLAGTLEVRAA